MEKEQARSAVATKVIDIIFTSLNLKHIDRSRVTESTTLGEDGLKLDSVDVLELIVNFEQIFHIKLDESEAYAHHFRNIGSIIDFVHGKNQAS